MKLTINYKNGNSITTEVHYVHVEDGKICYTSKNGFGIGQQIRTPIENVESYELTE